MEPNRVRWRRWLLLLSIALTLASLARCGAGSFCITNALVRSSSVLPDATPVVFASPVPASPLPTRVAVKFYDAQIQAGPPADDVTVLHGADGFVIDLRSRAAWGALPAIHEGVLIAGGGPGPGWTRLYGFDAHDGTPKWTFDLQDDGVFAPACDGGVCAFTTESCSLYVIDVRKGTPLWGKWLGDPLWSPPAIAGGSVFASYPSAAGQSVAALDARTGRAEWTTPAGSGYATILSVRKGRLSVAGVLGVEELDVATGRVRSARHRWKSPSIGVSLPGCEVMRSASSVACVDAKTGDGRWETAVIGPTDPILAGGSILVGTQQGQILRIDPASGEVLHRWEAGAAVRSEPLADGGWIYASTTEGIVAIDTKDPSITGWPQWGGDGAHSLAALEERTLPTPTPGPDVNALLDSLADPTPPE